MSQHRRSNIVEDHSLKSHKNEITHDFQILFRVLLAGGLAFPPLNGKKPKNQLCHKLIELSMTILALFVIFFNIFFWQKRYSSLTLHFSTSLTIFLALSVRFVLLLHRGDIPRMVKNLVKLYKDIAHKKPFKPLKNAILMSCFIPFLMTTLATTLDFYRIIVDQSKGKHTVQFLKFNYPDGRNQRWMFRLFLCLVPIKMYFAYGVSVMILIFCCSVYTVARRILQAFYDHIQKHHRQNNKTAMTSDILTTYLVYYNRISRSIAEIDNVLSPCVLLLYGLMVSGQFYTLTILISNDPERSSLTTGLHNAIVFVLTTAAFLVITLMASKVTDVSEDVKRSLQKLSEKINTDDNLVPGSSSCTSTYLILISILSGSHLSFTGWKMFNINRSFILTTMGVMISYGIVIVQIGRKYGEQSI